MEKRIIEIEKEINFLEGTVEDLNEVILEQQKKIEFFEREIQAIKSHMQGGQSIVKKLEDESPPPHY